MPAPRVGQFRLGFLLGIQFALAASYRGVGYLLAAADQQRESLGYLPWDTGVKCLLLVLFLGCLSFTSFVVLPVCLMLGWWLRRYRAGSSTTGIPGNAVSNP